MVKKSEPFANYVVYIQPEELQHQHKERDKEDGNKRAYKSFQDEAVEFFYHTKWTLMVAPMGANVYE